MLIFLVPMCDIFLN